MPEVTEKMHAGEAVLSEANGNRSREGVTILQDQVLKAGHVLGKVAIGTATPAAKAGGNTGNGTLAVVTVSGTAKAGVYKLRMIEPATNLGTFMLEDPEGILVGTGVVGTEFVGGGLTFTVADGATDFVAGDGFDITVAAGSGKYKEYNPGNTDGSQKSEGVLYEAVDATGADKKGVAIMRDAEVIAEHLQWFSGADANQKAAGQADLALAGIIAR